MLGDVNMDGLAVDHSNKEQSAWGDWSPSEPIHCVPALLQ